ncbi:hypothetical protein [Nocardioides sp. T2.26MG-1]|nr:hypothetical protein [Nocardioides sp. T2.26MG-1]CAI9400033.1 hypothetical protein HIDPHFAB_00322 [Nocardioides sp. T2.26MG-1]
MIWIILLLVVVAVVAYRYRVPLLAKILGQPQSRIERRLERRKD